MALKDEILQYLKIHPGATDTELERVFGKNHQHINITCRGLVEKGMLIRCENPDKDNRIGNFLAGTVITNSTVKSQSASDDHALQEEDIKHVLYDYLTK